MSIISLCLRMMKNRGDLQFAQFWEEYYLSRADNGFSPQVIFEKGEGFIMGTGDRIDKAALQKISAGEPQSHISEKGG